MATHSCLQNPMGRGAWWAMVLGQRVRKIEAAEHTRTHAWRHKNVLDKWFILSRRTQDGISDGF